MKIRISYTAFFLLFLVPLLIFSTTAAAKRGANIPKAGSGIDAGPTVWWSFNQEEGNSPLEKISGGTGKIQGPVRYVRGVSGDGLKLDGFRSFLRCNTRNLELPDGSFTVEAWVALGAYPWSSAPLLDYSRQPVQGFFFGINQTGHLVFNLAVNNFWKQTVSIGRIPLGKWVHLAGVYRNGRGVSLYINGIKDSEATTRGGYIPNRGRELLIGRTRLPVRWEEFQLTTENSHFFLDGIIDELKIYRRVLNPGEIKQSYADQNSEAKPELSSRSRLPSGPPGKGSFGAYYTRLDYYEEWDALWRVSEKADVLVRFEESAGRLVFWRGTSFVPCWVTENGIWYTNEWLETWGSDVESCAEPIMDRQCRFSHVRIIESSPARVVVHWRYPLVDAFHTFAAVEDDGRGEWCDEFHTIYPDQTGVRKMVLHYSRPERPHDWLEQIVVLPPGRYPEDVIETRAISLVNMKGEVHGYNWDKDLPVEMKEPRGANISLVNLKSRFRPFVITPAGPFKTVEGDYESPFFRTYSAAMGKGWRPDPSASIYGWWDHWPVAQIPGDGRWVETPDRPSHFNLTTFVQWRDHKKTDRQRTRIMLQGLTDLPADKLVTLANSWLNAPELEVNKGNFVNLGYDQAERAYIIQCPDQPEAINFELAASQSNPLVNPAFILINWGEVELELRVNGKKIPSGKAFRHGRRSSLESEDMILWLRKETSKPIQISLSPLTSHN